MITLDLHLQRDDRYLLTVLEPDGEPFDLTGATLALALRHHDGGAEILRLTTATGGGLTVVDAVAGQVEARFTPAMKAGLSPLAAPYWDLLLVTSGGEARPNDDLRGRIRILSTVTAP